LQDLQQATKVKRELVRQLSCKPGARLSPARAEERRKLDDVLLAMRAARRALPEAGCSLEQGNWLRRVRQATGTPAKEVARRLGVTKWELFRLEKAEQTSRIQLSSLRRAALALDCELVYAVVPRAGSLEDLAKVQQKVVEAARESARLKNRKIDEQVGEALGWEEVMHKAVRTELRKMGIRVR